MSLRDEQCNKVCRILDDVLANRPTEKDSLITAVRKAFGALETEQRWTPCSKRMPEEHEWIGTKKFGTTISDEVYVTFETPDRERFAIHISFQNGKLGPVDEQHMNVWYKGAKPIAWMPIPKPYEGKRE